MPRAHRHYVPGYLWHLTHRCHHRQFLLQFARDRRLWIHWLYETRRRFGLCVLDYAVTSNHVHLLVQDQGRGEIARSMQLLAGRTGQSYNARKSRRGAFWEDRYHATAVDTGEHLARCVVYIDLNMVRAGIVAHPSAWAAGGYHEIQRPRSRYRIISREVLAAALGIELGRLTAVHAQWIGAALQAQEQCRQPQWTDSVAVGGREFVERIAVELGGRARHRQVEVRGNVHLLREAAAAYTASFARETGATRP